MKKILAALAVVAALAGCSNGSETPKPQETRTPVTAAPSPDVSSFGPPASDAPTGDPRGPSTAFVRSEEDFLRAVKERNIPESAMEDQALVDLGDGVCASQRAGWSTADIVKAYLQQGIEAESTSVIIVAASAHLCPGA
jgi:hypothetical protein